MAANWGSGQLGEGLCKEEKKQTYLRPQDLRTVGRLLQPASDLLAVLDGGLSRVNDKTTIVGTEALCLCDSSEVVRVAVGLRQRALLVVVLEVLFGRDVFVRLVGGGGEGEFGVDRRGGGGVRFLHRSWKSGCESRRRRGGKVATRRRGRLCGGP